MLDTGFSGYQFYTSIQCDWPIQDVSTALMKHTRGYITPQTDEMIDEMIPISTSFVSARLRLAWGQLQILQNIISRNKACKYRLLAAYSWLQT